MRTTNRTRQAAFKSRMREAGKQQLTVWVTAEQAAQIKTMLASVSGQRLAMDCQSSAWIPEQDTAPSNSSPGAQVT